MVKMMKVPVRVYKCPSSDHVLLRIPITESIPEDTIEMTCPNGHRVKVPNFRGAINVES